MASAQTPQRPLLITIDGPAGAGKTTVSKILAQRLNYRYLDTGALYRGVALAARQAGIGSQDDQALEALCRKIHLDLIQTAEGMRVLLDDQDITDQIRTPQISMLASAISARPVVRAFLLEIQRCMGNDKRVVVEGRDMGTVVFPQADVKFFLDAALQTRAQRRYDELKGKKEDPVSLQTVEADMQLRDENDSTRCIAPLKPAPDAIRIDSSRFTIDQVVEVLLGHITRRL